MDCPQLLLPPIPVSPPMCSPLLYLCNFAYTNHSVGKLRFYFPRLHPAHFQGPAHTLPTEYSVTWHLQTASLPSHPLLAPSQCLMWHAASAASSSTGLYHVVSWTVCFSQECRFLVPCLWQPGRNFLLDNHALTSNYNNPCMWSFTHIKLPNCPHFHGYT